MKRKIAAIMAADIAGYSKLVAEDEEETLRRLASYRGVFGDFITQFSGRIFNTAGDAVLAEFPSAVEAVRCAIDVQESLRTRNLAYPSSRQMSFRIGITIGDVVEQEGDLLGDGVNIAARLEGLAPPGGLCVSRSVHEQVFNKLSVKFLDIGQQEVKNIPTPIHAYTLMFNTAGTDIGTPHGVFGKARIAAWPIAIVSIAAAFGIAISGYLSEFRATPPAESAGGVLPGQLPPAAVETAPPRPAEGRPDLALPETVPLIRDRGACAQITAACQGAGFTLGASREGTGLQADCIAPIMQGTSQPRRARQPLPEVDPQLVAECKVSNPRFGQGTGARGEPPAPSSPRSQAPR
jgi:class 3 adenylate cyclase